MLNHKNNIGYNPVCYFLYVLDQFGVFIIFIDIKEDETSDESKHNNKDKAACGNIIIYTEYHSQRSCFLHVSALFCMFPLLSFFNMWHEQNVNTHNALCKYVYYTVQVHLLQKSQIVVAI